LEWSVLAFSQKDKPKRLTRIANTPQTPSTVRCAIQHTQRTVHATFEVLGVATATSTVTVNSRTAGRKGEYFWKQLTASNGSAPDNEGVTVSVSGVTPVTGDEFIPKTPELYTHDDDGNILSDGRWDYTWDGENRLIVMETISTVPTAAKMKLEIAYDYMGRRIHKKRYTWVSSAWSLYKESKYLYDGWNLTADLFDNDYYRAQHMWGLDLSGSNQGAGGVGGLVKVWDYNTSAHYFQRTEKEDGSGTCDQSVKTWLPVLVNRLKGGFWNLGVESGSQAG